MAFCNPTQSCSLSTAFWKLAFCCAFCQKQKFFFSIFWCSNQGFWRHYINFYGDFFCIRVKNNDKSDKMTHYMLFNIKFSLFSGYVKVRIFEIPTRLKLFDGSQSYLSYLFQRYRFDKVTGWLFKNFYTISFLKTFCATFTYWLL